MGVEVYLAAAALVVGVYSSSEQQQASKKAANNQRTQMALQEQSRKEQQAANAERAAQERRTQIREERVRRAKIVQASENTGVAGSSGEIGSIAGLSTQLGTNLGANASAIQHAGNISDNMQGVAALDQANIDLQMSSKRWGQIGSISNSIFSLAGSAAMKTPPGTQAPAPVVNAVPSIKNY